ncbi:hypothetical protein Q5O89_15485 [Peribacillus frigoritolerans]|nr:hypothetical protein [Peribacillus frigoritolerans]
MKRLQVYILEMLTSIYQRVKLVKFQKSSLESGSPVDFPPL